MTGKGKKQKNQMQVQRKSDIIKETGAVKENYNALLIQEEAGCSRWIICSEDSWNI